MTTERNFEGPKDYLTAILLFVGCGFFVLGSLAFAKYLITPPTKPVLNVQVDSDIEVTQNETTECGWMSWNCGGGDKAGE